MGEIKGEQFNIDACKNCEIMLFDRVEGCYVDDCVDCTVFVGPASSSVFVRNCRGCTVVCICSQFRLRDCQDCRIFLMVQSQPVIESSQGLTFHCIGSESFVEVRRLILEAGLNPYNNFWSEVHDFSAKGSQAPTHKLAI